MYIYIYIHLQDYDYVNNNREKRNKQSILVNELIFLFVKIFKTITCAYPGNLTNIK